MLNLSMGFDPEAGAVAFQIQNEYLDKYFANFSGLVKKDTRLPKSIKVEKVRALTAQILVPLGKGGFDPSSENANALTRVINETVLKFLTLATEHEMKTTEFIPLTGYALEDLQKEVPRALRDKRKFCLVENYRTYERQIKNTKEIMAESFRHLVVLPGSQDYTDIICLIMAGKMNELQRKFGDRLKLGVWGK